MTVRSKHLLNLAGFALVAWRSFGGDFARGMKRVGRINVSSRKTLVCSRRFGLSGGSVWPSCHVAIEALPASTHSMALLGLACLHSRGARSEVSRFGVLLGSRFKNATSQRAICPE